MRAVAFVTPLLLQTFFILALAGCPTQSAVEAFKPIAPSTLSAPEWEVGQSWRYRSNQGDWQNWTVEGIEAAAGEPAYRVRVTHSRQTFEAVDHTVWYDRTHLGYVAYEDGTYRISSACPLLQFFPMENRTYSCRFEFENYGGYNASFEVKVGPWSKIQTPYADAFGLEIQSYDLDSEFAFYYHGWYNPSAENFLQYEKEGVMYKLVKRTGG